MLILQSAFLSVRELLMPINQTLTENYKRQLTTPELNQLENVK